MPKLDRRKPQRITAKSPSMHLVESRNGEKSTDDGSNFWEDSDTGKKTDVEVEIKAAWKLIFNYLRKCGLCHQDAEDGAQQIILRICKSKKELPKDSYLYRAAENYRNDYFKAARTNPLMKSVDSLDGLECGVDIESDAIIRDLYENKMNCESLNWNEKQVLSFRYWGYSHKQIGEALGLSDGMSRWYLCSAIKKLAE